MNAALNKNQSFKFKRSPAIHTYLMALDVLVETMIRAGEMTEAVHHATK